MIELRVEPLTHERMDGRRDRYPLIEMHLDNWEVPSECGNDDVLNNEGEMEGGGDDNDDVC